MCRDLTRDHGISTPGGDQPVSVMPSWLTWIRPNETAVPASYSSVIAGIRRGARFLLGLGHQGAQLRPAQVAAQAGQAGPGAGGQPGSR